MTARAEVLSRVRSALGAGGAVPEVPREYRVAGAGPAAGDESVVARFCERAAEYRATVRRVDPAAVDEAIAAACSEHGARRIVVAPGAHCELPGVELVADDPPLSPRDLDGVDGVLTGCALAIADTGTIVLDGGARAAGARCRSSPTCTSAWSTPPASTRRCRTRSPRSRPPRRRGGR